MLAIDIVMVLLVLFSQYFNINSSKVPSVVLRLYCICSCLCATFYTIIYLKLLSRFDLRGLTLGTLVAIEYLIWCVESQFTSQTYISTYTRAILSCDSLMGYTKSVVDNKLISILIMSCIPLSLTSLIGDAFVSEFWTQWISHEGITAFLALFSQWMMIQSSELSIFKVYLVLGLLQSRLRKLRQTLEENTIPLHIATQEQINSKLNVIRKCILSYKILLDAFDEVYGHVHLIMFVVLLLAAPELVITGYSCAKQLFFKNYLWRVMIVDAIRCLVKITAPCIICELCYNEVDQVKMLLVKQMTQSLDANLSEELRLALDYVTRRPFSFSLLRAFRVDVKLPVTFYAIAVTYIILMIEFSHFVL